jgi:regulator of replication initiation timing
MTDQRKADPSIAQQVIDLMETLNKVKEEVASLKIEVNYLHERVSEQEKQITMLIQERDQKIEKEIERGLA